MALKTVVQTLDDLDASLHTLYAEKDGKFILDLEGVDEHPSVVSLRNALDRQKSDRKKANDEIAKLKERLAKIPEDFDPDKYQQLLVQLEEYEADPAKKKEGDKEKQEAVAARKMLEQKIANMEKAHKVEIEKKDADLKRKDTFIGQLLIDDGLTKSLVEAGVGKEFLKATKAMLKDSCKVVEEDGQYKAVVDSDTGELDISRFVQDWVASDEGKPFIPPAKGSDAGNSGRPTKPISIDQNPWSKEFWNLTKQGELVRTDRAKAEKLAKAAGKSIPAAA
jgi:hypothetical protein